MTPEEIAKLRELPAYGSLGVEQVGKLLDEIEQLQTEVDHWKAVYRTAVKSLLGSAK
jgi:hypothetical protein